MKTSDWEGLRVLVTGADGFLGSHIVEALVHRGARVIAFTRGTSTHGTSQLNLRNLGNLTRLLDQVVVGNIAHAETTQGILDLAPDVIFHLAAEAYVPKSFNQPGEVFAVNATGTLHVLEAARRLPKLLRVVITSSSEVYGSALNDDPIGEDHPLHPSSPYGASKVAADRLAYSYSVTFSHLQTAIIRPFNTFGPRHTYDVIPRFIRLALNGEDMIIDGAGEQRRDFTYIDDMVEAFLIMGSHVKAVGEVVNFGSGTSYSICETAQLIRRLSGSNSRIIHSAQRLSEVKHLLCDFSKAKELFGWEPTINFEEGLCRSIAANTHIAPGGFISDR